MISNRWLLLLFLLLGVFVLPAQRLSDRARVSLLTMAPMNELYNQFGHSAIRIVDPVVGIDYCYNYGVYDFDTPNFYAKFVRGRLNYMMSVVPTDRELSVYQHIGRGVIEQDLNLSPDEVRQVFDFLRENYRPENRYYLYDFFFDNCATRIRDLFEQALDTRFTAAREPGPAMKTYRQLLDEMISSTPWHDFGIDFILGSPADRYADFRGAMFLPDYLAEHMSSVQYQGEPLLAEPRVLIQNRIPVGNNTLLTPVNVGWVLFMLALLMSVWGTARLRRAFDVFFFFLMAFCGWFLLFMRFGTDHFVTWRNFNLLWANPLYLFAGLQLLYPRRWLRWVPWLLLAFLIINLLLFDNIVQDFHPAILPFIAIGILRLTDHIWGWRKRIRRQAAGVS